MTKPRPSKGPTEAPAAQQQPERPEPASPKGGNAVQRPLRRTCKALAATVREPPLSPEQVLVWEKAAAFCVRNLPTLWTAGEPRREPGSAIRWLVPIVLRYLDGQEGKLGEMVFDEQRQEFTVLTDRGTLVERARLVAASRSPHGKSTAGPEAGA